ncbi:MAG: alginate export family protein [Phycisphaerae bacterium]
MVASAVRTRLNAALVLAVLCGGTAAALAVEDEAGGLPAASQPELNVTSRSVSRRPAEKAHDHFVRPRAWGAALDSEPPDYVRRLSEVGVPGLESMDWLDFGLEHRTRFELRDDDYRHSKLVSDEQFLLRSRGYVGVRKIFDPIRFGIEFQDSRQFASEFPEKPTDVNEADFVQAFVELYFENGLGTNRPLQLQAGRFTLDYADRRLVNRNRWQNAMNTFDGFRLRLGQQKGDWEVNAFATEVADVRLRQFDRPDEDRWFYGLIGAWRKWSQIITLEPYYFVLDEDPKDSETSDREIQTLGLHGYGLIGKSGFDYDFSAAFQCGDDGSRRRRAFAAYGEVGYSFTHAWNPRISVSTVYASGDAGPEDSLNERFDRLFVTARHWSTLSLFTLENVIGPKLRGSIRPAKWFSCDAYYGAYWLASAEDVWPMTRRQDSTGRSGSFVGHELDIRLIFKLSPRVDVETGYACFLPGTFARNTGPADDSDFFYVQTTVRLFE